MLVATLGKAFGVNGSYVTASVTVIAYLRETAPSYIYPNPITPAEAAAALVAHLFDHNILATGLNYPVVPQGDQEIRLQVSAGHTERDLDYLLNALADFRQ